MTQDSLPSGAGTPYYDRTFTCKIDAAYLGALASDKHININANINPKLNISFVNADEIKNYQALGFSFLMSRKPNITELLKLTEQELAILKLLMIGNSPQQIAGSLSMDDRNVRNALQSIREKLNCNNNIQLVIKIKDDGLDSYLFQNG